MTDDSSLTRSLQVSRMVVMAVMVMLVPVSSISLPDSLNLDSFLEQKTCVFKVCRIC